MIIFPQNVDQERYPSQCINCIFQLSLSGANLPAQRPGGGRVASAYSACNKRRDGGNCSQHSQEARVTAQDGLYADRNALRRQWARKVT